MTSEEVLAERERICRVATYLFIEHGQAGMTMRRIAAELGYTAMALYRYFPGGKDEVLAAVRTAGFSRLATRLESVACSTDDPTERVFALGTAMVRFVQDEPNAYRLLFELPQFVLGTYPEMDEAAERAWRPPVDAATEAVRAGILTGDPEALANLFFAGLHGVLSLHLSGEQDPGKSLKRLAGPMLESLFRGNVAPGSARGI